MSRRMKSHSVFLKFLYQSEPRQRKAILSNITKTQLDLLSEVALNIYKGVVPDKAKYVKSLIPYRSVIVQLASKSKTKSAKKETVTSI